jgi:hypothetical protein
LVLLAAKLAVARLLDVGHDQAQRLLGRRLAVGFAAFLDLIAAPLLIRRVVQHGCRRCDHFAVARAVFAVRAQRIAAATN